MLKKAQRNIDMVIIILIFLGAVLLYARGINSEYQWDDDYIYSSGFVGFANILNSSFANKIYLLGFLRHGPVPSLYFGLFYNIWEGLGLPFSRNAIQFPIALLSALAISLFYIFLRLQKFGLGLALGGALLLLSSPIFTMASRGIATYFAAVIVFNHILGLLVISGISENKKVRIIGGLALLHISASDSLFFVTLPIFAVAYAGRNETIEFNLAFLKNFLRGFWQNTKDLRNWIVSGPSLLMVTFTLLTSLFSIVYGLPDTRLSSLFRSHTGEGLGGLGDIFALTHFPQRLYGYLAVDFGELFPVFFILALILLFGIYNKINKGFVFTFAFISSAGYGLLFFVLSADSFCVKNLYQIYVLIPFLLLFLFALKTLRQKSNPYKIIAGLILVAAIITSGLATASYVWKKPYAFSYSIYQGIIHGTNNPNYGTKALGFIARESLTAIWDANPEQAINLYIKNNNTSFQIFSGLNNIQYFQRRYGRTPPLNIIAINEIPTSNDLKTIKNQDKEVKLFILIYDKFVNEDLGDLPNYKIIGDQGIVGTIFVLSKDEALIKNLANSVTIRAYTISELEKKFDEKYRKLGDYYPIK